MLRRGIIVALVAVAVGVLAQTASADPTNAKKSQFFTAICGSQQLQVSVNGSGEFTPATCSAAPRCSSRPRST